MTRSSKWFILFRFSTYNTISISILFNEYGRSEKHSTKIWQDAISGAEGGYMQKYKLCASSPISRISAYD
jgi:hypothetical protein